MDLDRLLGLSQPWGMRFVPRRVSLPMPPEGAGGQETKGFFRRLFGGGLTLAVREERPPLSHAFVLIQYLDRVARHCVAICSSCSRSHFFEQYWMICPMRKRVQRTSPNFPPHW